MLPNLPCSQLAESLGSSRETPHPSQDSVFTAPYSWIYLWPTNGSVFLCGFSATAFLSLFHPPIFTSSSLMDVGMFLEYLRLLLELSHMPSASPTPVSQAKQL